MNNMVLKSKSSHFNKEKRENGNFMYHTLCNNCGSTDANAVYDNDTTYCFSCKKSTFLKGQEIKGAKVVQNSNTEFTPIDIEYKELSARGIKQSIAQQYSYGYNNGQHICNYFNKDGEVVAQKFRNKNKEFHWIGNAKKITLFGMNLFKPDKRKKLIITEGEIDALSIAQLDNGKWPVVSIPNGAASAVRDIQKHLDYCMGFKEVVLCFDNDKPGIEASIEVAKLLPPNYCKIVRLPKKDANEMLVAGLDKQLSDCIWEAKVWKPEGLLSGDDIIERLSVESTTTSFPFPEFMSGTNEKTHGIRKGELDVYTSGTGSGKTTLMKQLQHWFLESTPENQCVIHLEESVEQTARDLVGIALDKRLHVSQKLDKDFYLPKAKELFSQKDADGFSRFVLMDNFGGLELEDLFNKIRFIVKGLNCKIIWIDHLHMLISGSGQEADERRTIGYIMSELKKLTQELNCYIGLVSHLNNTTTTPFENGGIPTVNNLKGSSDIKQYANQVYSFTRNQQAEDDIERNTSTFAVLKSRFTGNTGIADYLYFNGFTGRLQKGEKPEAKEDGKQKKANAVYSEFV